MFEMIHRFCVQSSVIEMQRHCYQRMTKRTATAHHQHSFSTLIAESGLTTWNKGGHGMELTCIPCMF